MSGDVHVRFCEGLGVRFPRATRLVILCRRGARAALAEAEQILAQIGLALNATKTRICRAPKEAFDFLGYRFGVQYHFGNGRPYVAAFPSAKSAQRLRAKLRRMVGTHMSWQSEENLVRDVNRVVRGWLNYFSYGSLWKSYTKLEKFLQGVSAGQEVSIFAGRVAIPLPTAIAKALLALQPRRGLSDRLSQPAVL